MPQAAEAIAALDPARVARRCATAAGDRDRGRRARAHADRRGPDPHDEGPRGLLVEREGAHAVALDLTIDEELRREGHAREIVHAVQNARKTAGLQVEDRIELRLGGDAALIEAAEAHRDYIAGETLAVELRSLDARRGERR